MNKIDKLWALFKQPSTKKGLIMLITAAGIAIKPELWESIMFAGGMVIAIYQIFRDEDTQIKSVK